ncbi:MAG: hypothetical protein C5B47_06230 [Verrucomicrobia bacterium]|nr:MAG: hypothetical protein C5B47_06230 [Verrucomicrobiota bacterium]
MPSIDANKLSLRELHQALVQIAPSSLQEPAQLEGKSTIILGRRISLLPHSGREKLNIKKLMDIIHEKGGMIPDELMTYYCGENVDKKKPLLGRDVLKLVGSAVAETMVKGPLVQVGETLHRLGLNSPQQAEKFFNKYFDIELEFKEFEGNGEREAGFPGVCQLIEGHLCGLGQAAFKEVYKRPECLSSLADRSLKGEIVSTVLANAAEVFKQRAEKEKKMDQELGQLRPEAEYDRPADAVNEGAMLGRLLDDRDLQSDRDIIRKYIKSFTEDKFTVDAALVPLRGREGRSQDREALIRTATSYFEGRPISSKEAEEFSRFRPAAST